MSDLVQSRAAEAYLADAKATQDTTDRPIEFALVHANLAAARAVRELDTTVRQGFEKVAQAIAQASSPRVLLNTFRDVEGNGLVLDVRAVQLIAPESKHSTRLHMANGSSHLIAGAAVDVSATIFQLVG